MAAYNCPVCRAAIPLEDVNVAADLALCRACGKTCSFAMLSGSSEISLDCLAHPPRGIRVGLSLNKPIYGVTAAYGHFGRTPEGDLFPWERTDLVDDLKAALA